MNRAILTNSRALGGADFNAAGAQRLLRLVRALWKGAIEHEVQGIDLIRTHDNGSEIGVAPEPVDLHPLIPNRDVADDEATAIITGGAELCSDHEDAHVHCRHLPVGPGFDPSPNDRPRS